MSSKRFSKIVTFNDTVDVGAATALVESFSDASGRVYVGLKMLSGVYDSPREFEEALHGLINAHRSGRHPRETWGCFFTDALGAEKIGETLRKAAEEMTQ